MNKRNVLVALVGLGLIFVLLLAGCARATDAAEPSQVTPGDGAALFKTHCSGCHGAQGQGGTGPRIKPPAYEREDLFMVIAQGIDGTAMQGFAGKLDEIEVEAIMDYLLAK